MRKEKLKNWRIFKDRQQMITLTIMKVTILFLSLKDLLQLQFFSFIRLLFFICVLEETISKAKKRRMDKKVAFS